MPRFSWEEIKELLEKSISEGFEAELRLGFADKAQEYMLIIYEDGCSFGRCGRPEEQTIEWFDTLDALYAAEQADGILLERDWGKISWMECLDFEMLGYCEEQIKKQSICSAFLCRFVLYARSATPPHLGRKLLPRAIFPAPAF